MNTSAPQYTDQAFPDLLAFLEATLWGSDGIRYQVRHYAEALRRLPAPRFFYFRDGVRVMGSALFFIKPVRIGIRDVPCIYLSLLSVAPEWQGQGLAGALVQAVLRQAVADQGPESPYLVTAYIEEANAPSLAVFRKQGFQNVGTFHASIIHRPHPKRAAASDTLLDPLVPVFQKALDTAHADHILTDFTASFSQEEALVLREGSFGRLLAGLQGHVEEWRVVQMEGLSGALILKLLRNIPWLKTNVLNPASARFLHLGNLWSHGMDARPLLRLVEDALARHGVPFAVGYFDKRSTLYRNLAAAGAFGLLNTAMETPVRVMAWGNRLTATDWHALRTQPLFISPLDIS